MNKLLMLRLALLLLAGTESARSALAQRAAISVGSLLPAERLRSAAVELLNPTTQPPPLRPSGPGDQNWDSRFGALDCNARVRAVVMAGSDVYVGGSFTTAGGMPANHIARWDGTAWHALGAGVNDEVRALAVIGTDVYAGGYFTAAGGVPAGYIARWDGTAWHPVGTGVGGAVGANNNGVAALAVVGGELYAGGWFPMAGGTAVGRIARWDGTTWSPLGTGMNGNVFALATSGTDLYAGGSFTTAGGVAAAKIARWNGSTWQALDAGVNASVYSLAVTATTVYAGGPFTTAGGIAASRIAKWDGATWSALGAGAGDAVAALAVEGTDVYAGGWFATAGGVPVNQIAKWDGAAWTPLGTGLNGPVLALVERGPDLYVGGDFTAVGDNSKPINRFGIYHPGGATGLASALVRPTMGLYPNPATSRVRVATCGLEGAVHLLDATGRVVGTGSPDAAGEAILEVSHLPPGVYTVRCGARARRLVVE